MSKTTGKLLKAILQTMTVPLQSRHVVHPTIFHFILSGHNCNHVEVAKAYSSIKPAAASCQSSYCHLQGLQFLVPESVLK